MVHKVLDCPKYVFIGKRRSQAGSWVQRVPNWWRILENQLDCFKMHVCQFYLDECIFLWLKLDPLISLRSSLRSTQKSVTFSLRNSTRLPAWKNSKRIYQGCDPRSHHPWKLKPSTSRRTSESTTTFKERSKNASKIMWWFFVRIKWLSPSVSWFSSVGLLALKNR